MSFDGFDELPDDFKKLFKEMMENLGKIKPEDIEDMLTQLFGEEFLEKIRDMSLKGGAFTFPLNPEMMKHFEAAMRESTFNPTHAAQQFDQVTEEEPYYELVKVSDSEGQLIVDMPGITDVRQVVWEVLKDKINVQAEADQIIYKLTVPISGRLKTKDAFAVVKNGTFILPYTR